MKKSFFVVILVLFISIYSFAVKDVRLLRMPDINNDIIAFVYAGDIWSVSSNGGEAKRLTSHKGLELFPKISPDGKYIAFSGEYSGSRQVYVIPVNGGLPKQLTYYNDVGIMPPRGGWDNVILDWTPDSKNILFRSNRTPYGQRNGKYFLISKDGGYEKALQIPEAGFGTFSPDGTKLVYTPISREFRTWKRTKGGRAADVWTYDLKKNVSKRLTNFPGTDQLPFWFKDSIYFVSDRDLRLNIYKYVENSNKPVQITNFKDYDVMWPSGSNGFIAFENGGYIHKLNLETGKTNKVSIDITYDNSNLLPYYKNVKRFVYNATMNNGGKRVVFEARGDLFSVPAKKKGITVNLTKTQGIRETSPEWSPDGKWIAYISDKTGNNEIYILDPKGKKASIQLTDDVKWKSNLTWSPDSKMIIYSMDRKLQLLNVKSKKVIKVDKDNAGNIGDYSWSKDSKWITYSKHNANGLSSIQVYSVVKGKSFAITGMKYNDSSPVFSSCGKYIYFVSDRDFIMNFQKGFSSMEFDFVMTDTSRMYAIALTKDAPNLFKDKNDLEELDVKIDKKDKKSKDKKKSNKNKKKKLKEIKFDLKGINERISAFPIAKGGMFIITDINGKLLYFKDRALRLFDIKTKKDNVVITGAGLRAISADNKKLLYSARGKWGIVDIKPKQKVGKGNLDLSNLIMKIDPRKEWKQIFNDGWRLYRDFFYVSNMHGVDWEGMRKKYSKLLQNLSHRFDLDYIFGEMVGEINVGHTYVNWGDFQRVKRVDTGLLGADIIADYKVKKYKIKKIYIGENWNERTRSPLTEQGINVNENDYILKINGISVTTDENFYKYMENTTGQKISITVAKNADGTNAKKYWIKPIKSELGLFYFDWVQTRRAKVDKLSNGKIAYIHVPNTAIEGNREFFKGLYAYSNKKAYIIDDRYNGGGWDPSKMINKLTQQTTSYWNRRNLDLRQAPGFAVNGPKVMLINHYSSSGGDNFPYLFRKLKLGKLIGTRTWGGLVGYSGTPRLVDGPRFAIPTVGIVGTDGEYIIEGVGMYPDKGYEVYDRSELVAKGQDPTLEKAVKYLLEELKKKTYKKPEGPKDPDRSKWFEHEIK